MEEPEGGGGGWEMLLEAHSLCGHLHRTVLLGAHSRCGHLQRTVLLGVYSPLGLSAQDSVVTCTGLAQDEGHQDSSEDWGGLMWFHP